MIPFSRVIDLAADWRGIVVIVLDSVDNTSGVSVLIVGIVAGEGCRADGSSFAQRATP